MRLPLRAIALTLALLIAPSFPLTPARADRDPPTPAADPDYTKAEKAVEAKDWDAAVPLLLQAASREEKNPDIYNLLGYAERHRGNMDAAFSHYAKALALDPKHRGAHEYVGEAYLLTGNLAKAEEHLAVLDKLCFLPCHEYRELKEKVGAYKQRQQIPTK